MEHTAPVIEKTTQKNCAPASGHDNRLRDKTCAECSVKNPTYIRSDKLFKEGVKKDRIATWRSDRQRERENR